MMNYEEILKETENHKWWSEEAPAVIQTLAYPLHAFVAQSKLLHPKLLSMAVVIFKNNYLYERTPEDEKYEVYKHYFEKMKNDRRYIEKLAKDARRKLKICHKEALIFIKNKKRMSNKELCISYTEFMNKYLEYLLYPVSIECIDIATSYHLGGLLKKELTKEEHSKSSDILFILTAPKKLSFMEKERIDFIKASLSNWDAIQKGRLTPKLKKQLDRLSKKYFFVLNNFKNARVLDRNYFFQKMLEEAKDKSKLKEELETLKNKVSKLKKKEKEMYKKCNFSEELKLHLKIAKLMGESIDERKGMVLKSTYYILLYCKEIARRYGIKEEEIKNYSFDEIKHLLLDNKKVSQTILNARNECSAYVMRLRGKGEVETEWFYGKEAEELLRKTSCELSEEIKGLTASAPVKKMTGEVQVILDVSKQEFRKGSILVTSMTRPDFVPIMRKAKAIITDEGGVTCHAAVLSRELGIPCIIGTKIATRVLKDGDMVEVDADKGIVRRIDGEGSR